MSATPGEEVHLHPAPTVQLVTWNLAGRVKRLSEQATLLLGLAADMICLQELAPSTLTAWQNGCKTPATTRSQRPIQAKASPSSAGADRRT